MNFHLQQIQKFWKRIQRRIDIQTSIPIEKNQTFLLSEMNIISSGVLFQDHFLIWQKMMNSGFEGKTT